MTTPPRLEHRVLRDVRIPVRDGLELSANLWLPVAPGERFPVILEMIPYGKDNWRRDWDTAFGEWIAARGFALCRLDVRGTGSSPGVALDEYTEAETLDGFDAVEWLAAQPWCTGSVGMWGISYGGFTSIQVAKLRPPHLRAILPMYATDDRYRDDVHIRGGCLTASEKSQYAVSQLGMNAMPPLPSFRGEGWRDEWRARLEQTPPWLLPWVREQTDGPYWRRGSLAPDYEALDCAVFQVAGWNDSYVDPAFRIQERCVNVERRTVVGNWVHSFPDDAYPGPNIDWLHELVRFFDHHLNGVDNGWDREPAITWFERTWAKPERFPELWPGRWRAAGGVPVPGTSARTLHLGPGSLEASPAMVAGIDRVAHRATAGTSGGLSWGAGWPPNGMATRPAAGRGAGAHLDVDAPRRAAVGHRHPGGRPVPVGDDARRDVRRAAVGGVARRGLGAGRDGGPQPDPPALGHGPGADARGCGRAAGAGAYPPARHRVPVHAGSPDPGHDPHELLAGPLAVAVPRRAAGPPRPGGALAARAAGVAGPRAHRSRPPRSRHPRPDCARSARASPTSRSGRPRRIRRPGR